MARIFSGSSTRAKRTYPSPSGPKLEPGVTITPACRIRSMQKSMLDTPFLGILAHMNMLPRFLGISQPIS